MDRKSSSWNVSLDFVIVLNLYIVVIYLSSGLRKLFQIYGPLTEIEHFFHFDIVDWLYVVYFRESSWVKRRFLELSKKNIRSSFLINLIRKCVTKPKIFNLCIFRILFEGKNCFISSYFSLLQIIRIACMFHALHAFFQVCHLSSSQNHVGIVIVAMAVCLIEKLLILSLGSKKGNAILFSS